MQVAWVRPPSPSIARRTALDEVTLDALAAELTVPHPRPLVDLERDDYLDLEVEEPRTVRFTRVDDAATSSFEPVTAPFTRPYALIEVQEAGRIAPGARPHRRWWRPGLVGLALVTVAIGFGLGAGIALVLV